MVGLGATFPATQALGWCSGCKIASKTTKWPSWIKSRLCSKETGGHVTLKVCKETETSRANSVICIRRKFTLRTRRKKSGTTLYTYERRMPLWKPSMLIVRASHCWLTLSTQYFHATVKILLKTMLVVLSPTKVAVMAFKPFTRCRLLYALLHEPFKSNIPTQTICWDERYSYYKVITFHVKRAPSNAQRNVTRTEVALFSYPFYIFIGRFVLRFIFSSTCGSLVPHFYSCDTAL